jgi:4-hydroxyproline epimerase
MRHTFFCIDGHTAGNPVRLVAGGAPLLRGASMSARRQDFLTRFDWIRTGLVLEPRGHDLMSGGFLYPPTREDTDAGILFIETSGCLPMCGHGTIGIITFALENGLLKPRIPGQLKIEVPAGIIDIEYRAEGSKVTAVKLTNVPAYLAAENITITVPNLGPLTMDIAYGGNFYAIIEPQPGYAGIDAIGPAGILTLSPIIRTLLRGAEIHPIHPLDPTINGVTHILWADSPKTPGANARNAVFYGDRAIDRSPCGTGTSARMAHLAAKGRLHPGDTFVHESIIGSRFTGRVEAATILAGIPAIIPSIEGEAFSTGFNTIWIDGAEPFPHGFQVT